MLDHVVACLAEAEVMLAEGSTRRSGLLVKAARILLEQHLAEGKLRMDAVGKEGLARALATETRTKREKVDAGEHADYAPASGDR
jgi:hypothetical protein